MRRTGDGSDRRAINKTTYRVNLGGIWVDDVATIQYCVKTRQHYTCHSLLGPIRGNRPPHGPCRKVIVHVKRYIGYLLALVFAVVIYTDMTFYASASRSAYL
jgi:hypothetical protein